jgi:hypothetical protein
MVGREAFELVIGALEWRRLMATRTRRDRADGRSRAAGAAGAGDRAVLGSAL